MSDKPREDKETDIHCIQNKQALIHWAAVTQARVEELRFIGMYEAAERLETFAKLLRG